jgi:hypothetical protein
MRLNKNTRIFINYFLGPVLFTWLCFSIYRQVQGQSHVAATWLHLKQSFNLEKGIYLSLAIALMGLNWGLETKKWQLAVVPIHRLRFLQAFKAVLSGVAFSVSTPNRTGEYVGRMLYMPEGKRLKVIAVSMVCSFSQLLITLSLGTIGFIILKPVLVQQWPFLQHSHGWIAAGLIVLINGLAVFYFNLSRLERRLERWLKKSTYLYLIEAIQSFGMQRLSFLLLLSFTRYCVFVVQYILLFHVFAVYIPVLTLFWIMCLLFLVLAVIPSITLMEIGVRGEVSLLLVGLYTTNNLGIVLTSVTVWLINLIIPALAGSILILGVRAFKKRRNQQRTLQRQQADIV